MKPLPAATLTILASCADSARGVSTTTDSTAPYDELVAAGLLAVANRRVSSRRWYVLTDAGREAMKEGGARG